MGGEICNRKGFERGPWYELKALRGNIAIIETRGGDATLQREIYKEWLHYPGYATADKDNRAKGFYGELAVVENKPDVVSKIDGQGIIPTAIIETPNNAVLSTAVSLTGSKRGRPRKIGKVSRVTAWRRKKELQKALI